MDNVRFDALARIFASLIDRRATTRAAAGGALAILGLAARDGVAAKKKKKKCKNGRKKCRKKCCKKGLVCRNGKCAAPPPPDELDIVKTGTLWTLQADGVITRTFEIPNGVTFEGNGKTIALSGQNPALTDGIRAEGGTATVRNLTIDGSAKTGACVGDEAGIRFADTSGQISNVVVTDLPCGDGIVANVGAGSGPGPDIEITDATISNLADGFTIGINLFSGSNPKTASISGCTIAGSWGISLGSDVTATIDANQISADGIGVNVIGVSASADVTDNTVTGAACGILVLNGPVTATGNTVVGPGPIAGPTFSTGPIDAPIAGIAFTQGGVIGGGSVDDNEISNFFTTTSPDDGCGILVAPLLDVDIGPSNTFPDPGNEEDICEFS